MFLGIPAATLFQMGLGLFTQGLQAYSEYNDDKKAEFIAQYGDLLEALENVPEIADAIRNPETVDTSSLKMLTLVERVAKKEDERDAFTPPRLL